MQEYYFLIVVAAEIAYFHIDFDAVGRKYTNVFITNYFCQHNNSNFLNMANGNMPTLPDINSEIIKNDFLI